LSKNCVQLTKFGDKRFNRHTLRIRVRFITRQSDRARTDFCRQPFKYVFDVRKLANVPTCICCRSGSLCPDATGAPVMNDVSNMNCSLNLKVPHLNARQGVGFMPHISPQDIAL